MNILTVIIVTGIGLSFIFSAVVLAACAVSSRASQEEGYVEEHYEYETESYGLDGSWVTEA